MKKHMLGRPAIQLAAAIFLSLSLAACASAPRATGGADRAGILAKASMAECEGIPLLRLRGSSYEVGFQYGSLLAEDLGEVQGEFQGLLDAVLGKGPKRWVADAYLKGQARKTLAALPAEYAEELWGVADGSGQSREAILLLAMTPELLFDANCSSFVTRDSGRLVHARNFDFYYPGNLVSRYPLVVRYEIEGKVPFVSAGFVGLFGCYTGANDAGISATEDTAIFARKPAGSCVPVGYALRMALENAHTLEEVRAIYRPIRTRGYLVTISSQRENDASVFELVNGTCVENRLEGSYIRVTNRCLDEKNRLANELILADFDVNTAREDALDHLLSRPTADPLRRAHDALSDRGFAGLEALEPNQSLLQDAMRTVNNYSSIQSCVIDPAARELHVSWAEGFAASDRFIKVRLDDLSSSASFSADGLLDSEAYLRTRDFVSTMHRELLLKGFSFGQDDYGSSYARVMAADMPPLPKEDWILSWALRLEDWERAGASADRLADLLPGSYYGPFWKGYSLLAMGQAEAARDQLEFAAGMASSPCASFIVSWYQSKAERLSGDAAMAEVHRAEAEAILARYDFSDGLAATLAKFFPDPSLEKELDKALSSIKKAKK